MLKNVLTTCVIVLLFAATGLEAQNVFVLPGTNSTAKNVPVFSANPFSSITGFDAGSGSFQVLAKPDGSKFYVIANSGSATVTVVSNTFANPRSLGDLLQQATAATISEDGKRLAVAAGLLHIYNTDTDADLTPSGLSVYPNATVVDVISSLDGKTFYALASIAGGGSVLTAIDASSAFVFNSLPISGPTFAVSIGTNGLLYVTATNQILELNPNTFKATGIGVLANKPGKLVFTPDGQYALAANQTSGQGAVLLLSLSSHSASVPNLTGVSLDRLMVLNSNTIIGYGNQTLYQISISSSGGLSLAEFSPPLPDANAKLNTAAAVFSNEVPIGGRSAPQFLYAAVSGKLYRENLSTNTVDGEFSLPITAGALSFAGPAVTGTPATVLGYGSQTVPPGAVSMPIVARVLDNNGNPLTGITVNFASNNTSASLSPVAATTGTNGYAVTYLTAPATSGITLTVTATAGSAIAAININVGGSGGSVAGLMKIVAGQGQMIREFSSSNAGAGSPLKVLISDNAGNPVSGAAVTFTITQGNGGSVGSGGINSNTATVNTDSNGIASVDYLASSLPIGTDFVQTTVTASANGTNSLNFYVTTVPITLSLSPTVRLLKPEQGSILTGPAGSTLTDAVEVAVLSGHGQAIPNVGITISSSGDPSLPGAACADPNGTGVLTDPVRGVAVCDLVLSGRIGSANLTVSVGYFTTTSNFTIQVIQGPPGTVKIVQGNNQSGLPGQRLPLALLVQVSDAFGNILPGVPVTFAVLTPGTVTLSSVSSATDPNGNASALATLGNIAGSAQVRVTAGTASATFTLTVNIPSTGIQKVSGDGQTTLINTTFQAPVVVKVVDATNTGVRGVQVNFQVTSGSGAVVSPSVTTDANGQALTAVNAGPNAGPIVVTATSSTFSVTFNLTSRLPGPTNVIFTNGASFLPFISPGAIAVISGNGIAPGVQGLVSAYNIVGAPQASLAGVSITFNSVTAPIYYILTAAGKPDQVVVQVPFETQPGSVNVTINAAGGGSATVTAQVQVLAPGIFEEVYGNQKIAVALRPDGSYVSPTNPAHRGETIRVYVTGLGQVTPSTATNSAGVPGQSVVASMIVGLNNGGVPLVSAEYAPGLVGVYVVALQVPSDTQTGANQPLGVIAYDSANNAYFAQGSNIAIQ